MNPLDALKNLFIIIHHIVYEMLYHKDKTYSLNYARQEKTMDRLYYTYLIIKESLDYIPAIEIKGQLEEKISNQS